MNEKDQGKLWKEHIEKIFNVENKLDHRAEADMVEGPVERVTFEKVIDVIIAFTLRYCLLIVIDHFLAGLS